MFAHTSNPNSYVIWAIAHFGYMPILRKSLGRCKSRMERWSGKVALVSGASVGIGFEIAKELARAGMKVVAFSRNPEKIQALADELSTAGATGRVIPKKCDVRQEDQVVGLFEEIRRDLGGVDVCVNNAGLAFSSPLLTQDTAEWKEMLDVNIIGLMVMTREYVKQMEERGSDQGHIVNLNSMSGHRMSPTVGFMFYTGTKYAVTALTEGTRLELRQKKSKIRVTSISPGLVRTEFRGRSCRSDDMEASKKAYDDICEEVLESEDIAAAVLYALAAPARVDVNDIFIRPTTQLG